MLDAVASTLDKVGSARAEDPPTMIQAGFVAAAPEQEIRLRWRGHAEDWLLRHVVALVSNEGYDIHNV